MPLAGLFGKEKERQGPSSSNEKDVRGAVIKLQHNTVTLERKLAEGGFAIVYLASDKNGRQYALKRQFISEDERQLQACKRECQIISSLSSHKNIVSYVDHLITQGRDGVYDYMLLTAYYRTSVLALMNERLMSSRCLSAKEVLSIFCDMCEAVARLHHSQTPVIHRDLKVENILIDDRNRDAPVFVLCDFGSATTKRGSIATLVDQIQ
uniref:non-specific serine/threonine protein kinase n=1 Tax=Plectus sambesii TaxID=2011161 RepID=A0A914W2G4_9BILA